MAGYNDYFKKAQKIKGVANKDPVKLKPKFNMPVKAKKKFKKMPITVVPITFVFLLSFVWLSFNYEIVEEKLAKIEVQFLGLAEASTENKTGNNSSAADAKSATISETKPNDQVGSSANKDTYTADELALFKGLDERKKQLDLREAELKKMEEELQSQREVLDKRLAEIEKLRQSVASQLEEKVQVDQERVNQLVAFYSTMKPQQAAKIIESLNEDLAVEVLLKMKKKNAAEIMNLINAEKAQRLSEKFTGYRRK